MASMARILAGSVALAVLASAGVAYAQREPAYESARSQGAVGEKADGYLGFVSAPTPAVRAMVEDINIKRKASYTRRAAATGSTVAEYAFTIGCNLIANTSSGEKYQGPDGSWQTRGTRAPVRDGRCI